MAALVILIICATITKVSVKAGSMVLYSLSSNVSLGSTFANEGNIPQREEKNKIKIYATKNSGVDIVVKVVAFITRSYREFRYKAAVIPKNNDSGTATIAVNVAKNSVFLSLSSSKSITVRDLSMPDEFRPEKD